jgi:hypothetical protein
LIQVVKERFGRRFHLTKAAHSTLTFYSVKHFSEVFYRLTNCLHLIPVTRKASLYRVREAHSTAAFATVNTFLSNPEALRASAERAIPDCPSEVAHSTPSLDPVNP